MSKKQEERKLRLLQVAEEHFTRYGYRKTSVDDIVKEAGIAKGTFYLHFKSKDALLIELLLRCQQEAGQEFQAAFAKAKTATEKLRTMLHFSIEVIERKPLLARLMLDEPEYKIFQAAAQQPEHQSQEAAMLEVLLAVLREGMETHEFRQDLDLVTLPSILGSLKLLHPHLDILTGGGHIERSRFIAEYVDILLRGLQPNPKPSSNTP